MKSIKFLLAFVLFAGISVSCSDDDDNPNPTGGTLEGRWIPTETVVKSGNNEIVNDYTGHQPGCDKDYIEFAAGNVFNKVDYNPDINNPSICAPSSATPASYTRAENSLTIGGNTTYAGTYTITRLTNSQMRLSSSASTGAAGVTTILYFDRASSN